MMFTSYFDGPCHACAPAAADVEQRHAGLKAELLSARSNLAIWASSWSRLAFEAYPQV